MARISLNSVQRKQNSMKLTYFIVPSGPPKNITAYNTSSQSIMITWGNVPVSQTNGPIFGFTVLFSAKRNTTLGYSKTLMDSDTHFLELKGLEIFHPYLVRVLARNRRGDGISSLPREVLTDMEGKQYHLN